MRTRLVFTLPIVLLGCAAQTRLKQIESAPPPQCESLGEVQGRGATLSDAKKDALEYADGMTGATHILVGQVRDWGKAGYQSNAGVVVVVTVYSCPPGAEVPASK
jgi:hypothetical protein